MQINHLRDINILTNYSLPNVKGILLVHILLINYPDTSLKILKLETCVFISIVK